MFHVFLVFWTVFGYPGMVPIEGRELCVVFKTKLAVAPGSPNILVVACCCLCLVFSRFRQFQQNCRKPQENKNMCLGLLGRGQSIGANPCFCLSDVQYSYSSSRTYWKTKLLNLETRLGRACWGKIAPSWKELIKKNNTYLQIVVEQTSKKGKNYFLSREATKYLSVLGSYSVLARQDPVNPFAYFWAISLLYALYMVMPHTHIYKYNYI